MMVPSEQSTEMEKIFTVGLGVVPPEFYGSFCALNYNGANMDVKLCFTTS